MKKLILITSILIIISMYFVPPYKELNDLAIIDKIGIEQEKDIYHIYVREVIPTKNNNGIHYQYKIYDIETNQLEDVTKELQKKVKKKLYLNKVKSLITNINSDINSNIPIKPKTIYHTNNIKEELGIKS